MAAGTTIPTAHQRKAPQRDCTKQSILPLAQINSINLDAHSDFRPAEGRHSGNGFRYAEEDGYLQTLHHRTARELPAARCLYRYREQSVSGFHHLRRHIRTTKRTFMAQAVAHATTLHGRRLHRYRTRSRLHREHPVQRTRQPAGERFLPSMPASTWPLPGATAMP